ARELRDAPVRWLLFTGRWRNALSPHADDVFDELETMDSDRVRVLEHVSDVRKAYGQCAIVFCPSYQESFCRVAAEAMLNGLPVVASDIPALRDLLGDGEA